MSVGVTILKPNKLFHFRDVIPVAVKDCIDPDNL